MEMSTLPTMQNQPSTPSPILSALPHLAVVLVALIGIIVLAALHIVTGEVAAGVIGVALGGGGTVAAANLTPNG